MTVNTRELIEAASIVAENHNLRVTVKSSLKAGAVVGASTFAGAVVRIFVMVKSENYHQKYFFSFSDRLEF